MNGADLDAAGFAEVVDRGLNVLRSRAEGDEDRVGVVALVFADKAVMAARELAKVLVGILKELQNGLGEVVPPRHNAVHVVFLVLNRPQENGVGQVHHLGNAAAGGSKQDTLRLRGAVDHVFRRAQVLADQLRLVLVERALQVARQEPVHDVHAGRQAQLGHAAQDQCLVGSLLGVLAEQHDPARVESAIDVVVAAVDVEGVLGERARAHFKHHRGAFARRVIVLLNAVDYALARSEVDHALAAHRVGNGATLGRVFTLRFNGDGVVAKDVEMAFGISLLEELAALRGRRDGVENAGVGDAGLGVI